MTIEGRPNVLARLAFWGALSLAVLVLWWSHLRFWFPHDEGTLAQAATRLLAGQVPHRDFVHPYSGLEALLHAGYLSILGDSLAAIRTGFAIVATAWLVGTAVWLRGRVGLPWAAALVCLLGAWGPAMYPAAVPSWYVTFLACGAAMLLSGGEGEHSARRQFMGGVLLGLAIAFKITALYAVAGAGIWLVVRGSGGRNARFDRGMVPVILLSGLAVVLLLRGQASSRVWVHVGLPALAVVAWATAAMLGGVPARATVSVWERVRPSILLGVGVLVGILPLIVGLWAVDALRPFLASLSGVGASRAAFASFPPPPLSALLWGGGLLGVLWAAATGRIRHAAVPAGLCAAVFLLAWDDALWHRQVWQGVRAVLPLGLAAALAFDLRGRSGPVVSVAMVMTGWMALSQYPFAAPVYFVYLMPLLVLAVASLVPAPDAPLTAHRTALAVTLGLAAFGYLQVVPSPPTALGWSRYVAGELTTIPGPHGGLRVPRAEAEVYEGLLRTLRDSVPRGAIWAGPDSPEVAYLAGRPDLNPTPFTFLDSRPGTWAEWPDDAAAVVVRRNPAFSPPVPPATLEAGEARFRQRAEFGPFLLLWGRAPCTDC